MKTLSQIVYLSIIFLTFNFQSTYANWQKSNENNSTPYTPQTKNDDSLPSGVTQDWLNSLTDENGNQIIPEEDPETDALQQKTFDGVVAGDEYGRSVSSAGDVNGDGFDDVIIGAPRNNAGGITSGRAYIFFGGTVINNSVDVILTGGAVNNYLGSSVSSAGDVNSDGYDDVIIGAPGYNSFTGRAYIYYGGVSMNSTADVTFTGEISGHNFGRSVSGAGDVNNDGYSDVIVGAYGSNVNTGKAYVFYGGVSMNNISDVTFTGETSQSYFGSSVSGAGDVNGDGYHDVIIGAYGYNADVGKAYIYFGGASMDNIADVNMFGGAIADFFGASVSNAGDVNDDGYSDVIVGAYGSNSNTGRAYIFYGGASMNNVADVTITGEATNNSFGYSVSDAGDVNGDGYADVYIGAYGFSSSKGRAYLYYGGAIMNNVVDIFMTGETNVNYFGYSVSGGGDINGDGYADMIAGAFGYNSSTGRAYVYTNTMTGEDISDVVISGEASLNLGWSVSTAGDVNGDGYADVIVGAPGYSLIHGKAYIFFGSPTMDSTADVTFIGSTGYYYGISVSTAGDVNGDGYDDVIIGSRYGQQINGKAYLYYGGSSMDNGADKVFEGVAAGDELGNSVSTAGDVNDDGYSDIIIGAKGYSSSKGRSYIFFGGASMDDIADVTMTGENASDLFGYQVSSARDVNGDGFDDVIVGAVGHNSGTGRAYVFYGGVAMNNAADVTMTGGYLADYFGNSVSVAGDVNGDGYSDVMVGAPGYNNSGQCYVFYGNMVMDNVADVILSGEFMNDYFGESVSGAGDVNGDGFADVIVGASGYNNYTGRAYIFYGNSAMDNVADVTMAGENTYDYFGFSVSDAGDVNADGKDDVIAGAIGNNSGAGKAYIYLSSFPDNRKNLFLFGAIQGLYDPVLDTEVPDTIKVYLRNSTSPFARVDSSKNILLGPGTGQYFLFGNVQNGIPYYIEVTHRNALATWSATPVSFVNSDASIAYSVNSIYAYGNNEIQVDASPYNVFAFYSGDVNQDGAIDLTDVITISNAANSFLSGYVVTDLTGNNVVDLTDVVMAYNNSVNFVNVIKP